VSKQPPEPFFAEIIESHLDHFLAQSWQWNNFPIFGSLVYVEDDETLVFGCVTHIQVGSMDPMRYPFPYQKTEAELYAEQPQIFEFLRTTFKVQVLGFCEKKKNLTSDVFYLLPPRPCKIHGFVGSCPSAMQARFFQRFDFLHVLFAFASQIQNIDELLLVMLKQLIDQKLLTQEKQDQFFDIFSLVVGNDYRRLKLFFQRAQQLAIK
jgi:hypothetical protein